MHAEHREKLEAREAAREAERREAEARALWAERQAEEQAAGQREAEAKAEKHRVEELRLQALAKEAEAEAERRRVEEARLREVAKVDEGLKRQEAEMRRQEGQRLLASLDDNEKKATALLDKKAAALDKKIVPLARRAADLQTNLRNSAAAPSNEYVVSLRIKWERDLRKVLVELAKYDEDKKALEQSRSQLRDDLAKAREEVYGNYPELRQR